MTETIAPPKTKTDQAPEDLVRDKFPCKRGEFRRIHDLFEDGTVFRVNFHDEDTNFVVRSYFVVVKDGEVKVR